MGRRTPTGNWNGKCCWPVFAAQSPPTPPTPPTPAYHAATMDPDTGEMLPIATGDGPMTVGRDTDIWLDDYQSHDQQFADVEPGWSGGRVVRNYCEGYNNFGAWVGFIGTPVLTPGFADPDGGNTAWRITGGSISKSQNTSGEKFKPAISSLWIRRVSGSGYISFTESTNNRVTRDIYPTSEWRRYRGSIGTVSGNNNTVSYITAEVPGDVFEIYNYQGEPRPGVEIADFGAVIPQEFIPVSVPLEGKVYGTTNGNTVDGNNVITEARGTDLPEMPWIVSAPQATNYFLNSQAPVTQTISGLAAVAHTCWLEGTGTATLSGGASGVVSDGVPVTFTPTGNVTVTIAGGPPNFVQLENNASPSPPIFTEGAEVTRGADIYTVPTSNHDETNAAIYCEMVSGLGNALTSTDNDLIVGNPAVTNQRCLRRTRHAIASATTGTAAESVTGDMDNGGGNKVGLVYDNTTGKMRVCVNGTWGVEVTDYVGVPIDVYQILGNIAGVEATNKIRNLQEYRGTYEALTAVIDGLMA